MPHQSELDECRSVLDAMAQRIRVHLAPEGAKGQFPVGPDSPYGYAVKICTDEECGVWRHLWFAKGDELHDYGDGDYSVPAVDLKEYK